MRAFWAILKDSFREAMASRVLQFLLGGIVLFLLLLAIPGLRVEALPPITRADFRDEREFVAELGRLEEPTNPAERWVVLRFDPQTIAACRAWRSDRSDEHFEAAVQQVADNLNRMLDDEMLYDRDSWKTVLLNVETRKLLLQEWSDLTVDQRRRRNRQLLAGALAQLKPAEPSREYITYVVDEVEFNLPGVTAAQLVRLVFYQIIKWMLGAIGVFLAILFTASIVPKMFEPGAIDLLMSKPVSRIGVFLAKFVGGCVFILMNGTVLIVGMFVILWLRYDIWNPKLLLAIPLQIFSFMIFFSISTFAGARWRNVILSVALTLVAWVLFWGVHQTWYWSKMLTLNAQHPEIIVTLRDELIVAQKNGNFLRWNGNVSEWTPINPSDDEHGPMEHVGPVYRWIGPVAVEETNSFVAVERMMHPQAQMSLSVGPLHRYDAGDSWSETTLSPPPSNIEELAVVNGARLICVTRSGLFEYQPSASVDNIVELLGNPESSVRLHADAVVWSKPFAASVRPDGKTLISTAGRLEVWEPHATGDYQRTVEHDTGDAQPALVGLGAKVAIIARESGDIQCFDLPAMTVKSTLSLDGEVPRQLIVSPDGTRAAILTQERRVHLFDISQGVELPATLRNQGELTAIAYTAQGELLVGDRYPRITRYSSDFEVLEVRQSMSTYQRAFTYVINPLRIVLPQPDELDELVKHVVLEDDANGPHEFLEDLTQDRGQKFDMATTFWSNSLFIVFMLTLTSLSIHFRDL